MERSVCPPNRSGFLGLPAKVDHGNATKPVWVRLDFPLGLNSPLQLSVNSVSPPWSPGKMELFRTG